MDTIRIRLKRVIDFGPIVSMSGIDLATNLAITVYVDCRPSQGIWAPLAPSSFAMPVAFDAKHFVLSLELIEDEEIGHA